MKKFIYSLAIVSNLFCNFCFAFWWGSDGSSSSPSIGPGNGGWSNPTPSNKWQLIYDIPELKAPAKNDSKWSCTEGVAQFGMGDWSCVIAMASHVTLDDAKKMADSDPNITFFFHVTGDLLIVADTERSSYRLFKFGDAVFFSGEPEWGAAPNRANGYIKNSVAMRDISPEGSPYPEMAQTYPLPKDSLLLDRIDPIPQLEFHPESEPTWKCTPKIAPAKFGDWSRAIGRARCFTLDEAKKIASANPTITHFYYVQAGRVRFYYPDMEPISYRCFGLYDAIFFTGSPQSQSCANTGGTMHCYIKSSPWN